MYSFYTNLRRQPIISLQTGEVIAWLDQPIIDIANLQVIAFRCKVPHHDGPMIVMSQDIRQFAVDCLIIDDEDQLTEPADIVRLGSSLQRPYTPVGKRVIADTGRKLGKVEDYTINQDTQKVQRLHVRPYLWQSMFASNTIIDRTQIVDITIDRIIVRDATITEHVLSHDSVPEIHP